MQWSRPALVALGVVLLVGARAAAQHDEGDMQIGSRGDGRGAVAIAFDVTTPVRVTFSDVLGSVTTYTANDPGFGAPASDGMLASLRAGTEVRIELVANDDGRTAIKVHDTVLDVVGQQAVLGNAPGGLHHHPEFQLRVRRPPGAFADGTVAFRLITSSPRYEASPVYALRVSNGFLAPATYSTAAYDARALRCQATLSRERRRFLARHASLRADCPTAAGCDVIGADDACDSGVEGDRRAIVSARDAVLGRCDTVDARQVEAHLGLAACRMDEVVVSSARTGDTPACHVARARAVLTFMRRKAALLDDCLLRIQGMKARQEAGQVASRALVEATCTHAAGVTSDAATLLGRIARARRRALATIRRACGTTQGAAALLRRSACHVDEMLSAAYASAKADLAAFPTRPSQGGAPLAEHLPCLRGGSAHTHDHAH